jgi:predicted AAA+ superfamily ATPase
MQVRRREHVRAVRELLRDNPVVAILGPRQVGKTTLARQVSANWRGEKSFYDLEDEVDRRKLQDPGVALREAKGLVVLDEVQQLPEVFRLLRVLADRRPIRTRFLVLGSASPELLRQSSESLAGRIAFHDLDGLHAREVDKVRGHSLDRLWLRGGFPASYLARNDEASLRWRQDFVRTFLQRDVPALMPPSRAPLTPQVAALPSSHCASPNCPSTAEVLKPSCLMTLR